ncbi:FKBP-type peptidyl-prolyl cis-trans isomerase [Bacteroidales bacterium]|nr:FKBP-type peptidyl-prolyl cis-trans isomerase [Bacteroidales bacterium]
MDKISYALGLSIGHNFKSSGIKEIILPDFYQALEDVVNDRTPQLSFDEAKVIINEYFMGLQKEQGELNIKAGEEFLKINKEREGVVCLESGLQYQIINEGSGSKPTADDQVECHYEGALINGKIFDSSIQRGEPAIFGITQVIAGWTEALQLMSEGSKWRLFIPSSLAYGTQQAGELIEPNSCLVFEVELLKIV